MSAVLQKVVPLRKARNPASAGAGATKKPQGLATGTRVAWNAGLSDAELRRPGGALLAALLARAIQKGDQLSELASKLGCTYSYVAQMRGGSRKVVNISDDMVDAAALYLDLPRLSILMLCGRVMPDDIIEQKRNVAQEIPGALDFIAQDPIYGPLMPADIRQASYELQFCLITMFENLTGKKLLTGRQDPLEFAVQLKALLDERERLGVVVETTRARKNKSA